MTRLWSIVLALLLANSGDRRGRPSSPRLSCGRAQASNSAFRRTMALIRSSAPSGGTSRDGWTPADGPAFGFQVTFFRPELARSGQSERGSRRSRCCSRTPPSPDPRQSRLLHDQRAAPRRFRIGGSATTTDMDVVIDDWTLKRTPDDRIVTKVAGKDFALDLSFAPTQPVLLPRREGLQQEGPASPNRPATITASRICRCRAALSAAIARLR